MGDHDEGTAVNPPEQVPAGAADDDDAAALAELRAAYQEHAAVIASGQGVPVERPEKYAFPIGFDDDGNPFPVTPSAGGDDGEAPPEPG
jgi:hypothetical protein